MTYTIEQLRERRPFVTDGPVVGLYDYYRLIPELITELEARDREIERLKALQSEYVRGVAVSMAESEAIGWVRLQTAKECAEMADATGRPSQNCRSCAMLIRDAIKAKFGVPK